MFRVGVEFRVVLPFLKACLFFENYPLDSVQETDTSVIQTIEGHKQAVPRLRSMLFPGDKITFDFSYDTRRFDAATIERMVGHFQTLLASMVAKPSQRIRICRYSLIPN